MQGRFFAKFWYLSAIFLVDLWQRFLTMPLRIDGRLTLCYNYSGYLSDLRTNRGEPHEKSFYKLQP